MLICYGGKLGKYWGLFSYNWDNCTDEKNSMVIWLPLTGEIMRNTVKNKRESKNNASGGSVWNHESYHFSHLD